MLSLFRAALAALLSVATAACGYSWDPAGDPISLQVLRREAPVWSHVVAPPRHDLAACLSAALQGPGTIRLVPFPDDGGARLTYYPSFYRATEDFEVTILRSGDSQTVEMRHHAAESPIAELLLRLDADVARVRKATTSCTAA